MKKTYEIEVDCGNCASKMEEAVKKTTGVKDAMVNYMAQKISIEFEEDVDMNTVIKAITKNYKRVTDDCEIIF